MHLAKQLRRETARGLMFIGYNVAPVLNGPGCSWNTWHNNWNGIASDMYIFQVQFINSLINVMLSRTTILLLWE